MTACLDVLVGGILIGIVLAFVAYFVLEHYWTKRHRSPI
jgi:hypothetical protein